MTVCPTLLDDRIPSQHQGFKGHWSLWLDTLAATISMWRGSLPSSCMGAVFHLDHNSRLLRLVEQELWGDFRSLDNFWTKLQARGTEPLWILLFRNNGAFYSYCNFFSRWNTVVSYDALTIRHWKLCRFSLESRQEMLGTDRRERFVS